MEFNCTEKKIFINAAELFMKYGIKSHNMDDIARHLKISKKTLYKCVDNKNDLVNKIMELQIERDKREIIKLIRGPGNVIDRYYEIYKYVSMELQTIQPAVIYDLQNYYPEAWTILDDFKTVFIRNKVKEELENGIAEGFIRDDIDVEIIATANIVLLKTVFSPGVFSVEKYSFKDLYHELFKYHIRGIASKKGLEYIIQLNKKLNK